MPSNVIWSTGVSLDGYIAGPDGEIDWTAPDEELHRFHNEQTGELAAHLCGRRLHEAMLPWEGAAADWWGEPEREFARLWQALPKVVHGRVELELVETRTFASRLVYLRYRRA